MTFTLTLHPRVQRSLRRLSKQLSERIVRKFKVMQADPFRYLEHHEGKQLYKLRIGDYRALVAVDIASKRLKVEVLDNRSRVYKR